MKGPVPVQAALSGAFDLLTLAQIKSGQLTERDIEVFRALLNLENSLRKRFPITFKRALPLGDHLVLFCEGPIGALVGPKGAHIQALSEKLAQKIRVVKIGGNPKALLTDLLGRTAKIAGASTTFSPNGTQQTTIVLSARHARFLEKQLPDIEKALNQFSTIPVVLVLETPKPKPA